MHASIHPLASASISMRGRVGSQRYCTETVLRSTAMHDPVSASVSNRSISSPRLVSTRQTTPALESEADITMIERVCDPAVVVCLPVATLDSHRDQLPRRTESAKTTHDAKAIAAPIPMAPFPRRWTHHTCTSIGATKFSHHLDRALCTSGRGPLPSHEGGSEFTPCAAHFEPVPSWLSTRQQHPWVAPLQQQQQPLGLIWRADGPRGPLTLAARVPNGAHNGRESRGSHRRDGRNSPAPSMGLWGPM